MLYQRGQTYRYKFNWSIKSEMAFLKASWYTISTRKNRTEAKEVEHEHRRAIRLVGVIPLDLWPKPPAPEASP